MQKKLGAATLNYMLTYIMSIYNIMLINQANYYIITHFSLFYNI